VDLLTDIIRRSAQKHIRKNVVHHRYHLSRSEKKEQKLLKSLRAYTRKFKKEIRNTESKHYKHVQAVKQDITKLQERQRLEQERYLDKKISEANEQRDYRKLKALIDSYQKEKPTPANSTISCVKDGTETIRTTTDGILRAFREYWSEIFSTRTDLTSTISTSTPLA